MGLKKLYNSSMETDTYVGVADCYGIESFHNKDDTTPFDRHCKIIRADANRHRHAVYFEAELDPPAIKLINESLSRDDWAMALEWLKSMSLALVSLPQHEQSWKMIPDIDLDPYA
mgnify:FL=1